MIDSKTKSPAEVAAENVEDYLDTVVVFTRADLIDIINEALTKERKEHAETLERLKIAKSLLGGPTNKRHDYNEKSELWKAGYWTAFKDIRGEYESRINPQKAGKITEATERSEKK